MSVHRKWGGGTGYFLCSGTGSGALHRELNDAAALSELLRELAEGGGTLVLYAHEIAPVAKGNHIHPDRLAAVLAEAHGLGLRMNGL